MCLKFIDNSQQVSWKELCTLVLICEENVNNFKRKATFKQKQLKTLLSIFAHLFIWFILFDTNCDHRSTEKKVENEPESLIKC